jgi:RNA polymerase sigma-70 factor (ECF subfamily)
MQPNTTSELLVTNIANAPAAVPSFGEVAQRYWRRIFRFVLASVRDVNEAECLTQDCFCRAFKAWNRFRGDSSVETWLMHIAVNVVRDFFRNRRLQFWRRAPVVDVSESGCILMDRKLSPETNAMVQEQLRNIWAATEILPAKQRTVFLLRFVDEMELSEIAHVMGITEGSVKVHLFRAVRAIRKRLGSSQ